MKTNSIYVGCTGFNYNSWKAKCGGFYPPRIDNKHLLDFYVTLFSCCEINSTFYNIPKLETTQRWAKSLPEEFVITAKLPKIISQAENLAATENELLFFLNAMEPLKKNLGPFILQCHPNFDKNKFSFQHLEEFLDFFPLDKFELAVELRHTSWYNEDTFDLLNNKNVGIVSSYLPYLSFDFFEEVKNEYCYIRLIGSHNQEIELGKEGVNREEHYIEIISRFNELMRNKKKFGAFVMVNNHYSGYAPPIAKKIIEKFIEFGYEPVKPIVTAYKGQSNLSDFFS